MNFDFRVSSSVVVATSILVLQAHAPEKAVAVESNTKKPASAVSDSQGKAPAASGSAKKKYDFSSVPIGEDAPDVKTSSEKELPSVSKESPKTKSSWASKNTPKTVSKTTTKKNPAAKAESQKSQTVKTPGPSKEKQPTEMTQKVPPHFKMALMFQSMGGYDQAIGHYREAMKADPKFVSTYNNLAQCLISRGHDGDLEEAEQLLGKVLALDSKNAGSLFVVATLREAQKNFPSAIAAYKAILSTQPLNFQAVQNLSELYFRQGDKAAAKNVIEVVLKNHPPEAHKKIYEQALANLEKVEMPEQKEKSADQPSEKKTLSDEEPAKAKTKS